MPEMQILVSGPLGEHTKDLLGWTSTFRTS